MLINMELHKKLKEALQGKPGDGFLIMVSRFDKKNHKLEHYRITNNFPKDDIVPTLEHYVKDLSPEMLVEENNS